MVGIGMNFAAHPWADADIEDVLHGSAGGHHGACPRGRSWAEFPTEDQRRSAALFSRNLIGTAESGRFEPVRDQERICLGGSPAAARARGPTAMAYWKCGAALAEADLAAIAAGRPLCCEVNLVPPNPGSLAFHDRLGFAACGEGDDPRNGKRVRYLIRP